VFQAVFQTVSEILQKAADKGLTSVALTPLGIGKRFQYDKREVADATVDAILQFLYQPSSLKVR
jgi:O-acetyl-ADP-ribose deacetylase (regulator of RNase III)